jgi:hypothetical protein
MTRSRIFMHPHEHRLRHEPFAVHTATGAISSIKSVTYTFICSNVKQQTLMMHHIRVCVCVRRTVLHRSVLNSRAVGSSLPDRLKLRPTMILPTLIECRSRSLCALIRCSRTFRRTVSQNMMDRLLRDLIYIPL